MSFAVSDFESGKTEACEKYKLVLDSIGEELSALMVERQKLFSQGGQTGDIEQAIKNLLGSDIIAVLAKRVRLSYLLLLNHWLLRCKEGCVLLWI